MVKTRSQQLKTSLRRENTTTEKYFRKTPSISSKKENGVQASQEAQTNLLNELQNKLSYAREKEDKYSKKYKEKGNDSYKIKKEGYEEQVKALNKLINNVKGGNLYEMRNINIYLSDVYSYGKDKQRARFEKSKPSISSKVSVGNIGTGLIEITDTRTGTTTSTKVNLDTGSTISKKVQRPQDITPKEVFTNIKETQTEVKQNQQILKKLYNEKGLKAGIIDSKTGKVKQEMRDKVNLQDLRTIARLENTIKLQKENIKEGTDYLKDLKQKISQTKPKEKVDLKEALKVNLDYNIISPTNPVQEKKFLNLFSTKQDYTLIPKQTGLDYKKLNPETLKKLSEQRFKLVSPYQTANKRYKEFLNYATQQEAKGNYATGTIAKLLSLPSAVFSVASENLIGLWTIAKNPSELRNINTNTILKYGQNLGKGVQSGDPKSMVEFIDLVSGNGIFVFDNVPKISKVSLKMPNVKVSKYFATGINNFKSNLNNQLQYVNNLLKKDLSKSEKAKLNNLKTELTKYKKELNQNKLNPKLRKDLINFSELLKKQNKEALKTLFEKQYKYKPTLKEIKVKTDFIREVNTLKNKISRFETKIKNKNLNEIEKKILESKNKLNKVLLQRISSKIKELEKVKSISEQNKIISFLTNELKKNKKLIRIEDKINKLENKLKVKGKVDIAVLKPQDRVKIETLFSKLSKVQSLTLAQLGNFEKSIDNLLKKKFITRDIVKSTSKTKKELSLLSKKAQLELSKAKKIDIDKVLLDPKAKKQINERVKNVEKQIISIRTKLLKNIFLIDDVKNFNLINSQEFTKTLKVLLKDSKLSKQDKVKILNAEGTIKTLSDRIKQLKSKTPTKSKTLNQNQFELRRKQFEEKIGKNKPIIASNNKGLTAKIGEFEISIEYIKGNSFKSFKANKKGQLGGNSARLKVELKKIPNLQKAPLKKYYENKFSKSFSNNRAFNRYIESFNVQKRLSDKAKRYDKLRATPIQKKKIRSIKKQIRELEVKQKQDFKKLYKYIVLKDIAVKTQIKEQLKKQLQLSNKNSLQMMNALKDLDLKLEKYSTEVKLKGVEELSKKIVSGKIKDIKTRDLPPTRKKTRSIKTPKDIKPRKIPKLPLDKLNFNTKIPKGYNLVYDVVFRERRNINKPYNSKTNPRVNKVIKLDLPINRALDVLTKSIDTTTAQRVTPIISGVKKIKDVTRKPALLKKFSIAKNKDGRSYKLQEKKKYLIDTKGEKKELSLQKIIKKNLKSNKSSKKRKK